MTFTDNLHWLFRGGAVYVGWGHIGVAKLHRDRRPVKIWGLGSDRASQVACVWGLPLLDRDGLSKVARLIDVQPASLGDLVGE